MDYIRGVTRNQVILFPETVEDYITEDANSVRTSKRSPTFAATIWPRSSKSVASSLCFVRS